MYGGDSKANHCLSLWFKFSSQYICSSLHSIYIKKCLRIPYVTFTYLTLVFTKTCGCGMVIRRIHKTKHVPYDLSITHTAWLQYIIWQRNICILWLIFRGNSLYRAPLKITLQFKTGPRIICIWCRGLTTRFCMLVPFLEIQFKWL